MRADKAWLAGKVGHLAKGHNTVSAHARTSHRALPTGSVDFVALLGKDMSVSMPTK